MTSAPREKTSPHGTPDAPAAAGGSMRAAFIRETGGPEQIEVGRLPVPQLGPRDVLVRLEASAVDHVDLLVRSGAYRTPLPMPFVIGRDLVGVVEAHGALVDGVEVGERVWSCGLGYDGRRGAFSELVAVPSDRLYRLPADADPIEAASVLHGAATAWLGLVRETQVLPGRTVVIGGAGGAVGSAAVQLASAMGARVVATASPRDEEWVRRRVADAVIDHHAEGMLDDLRAALPDGADIWWDTSGRQSVADAVPLLRTGGTVLVTAGMSTAQPVPTGELYVKDASIRGFALSNAPASDLARAACTINAMLASGRLRGRVARVLTLDQAREAHEAMERGDVTEGRIVIVP